MMSLIRQGKRSEVSQVKMAGALRRTLRRLDFFSEYRILRHLPGAFI